MIQEMKNSLESAELRYNQVFLRRFRDPIGSLEFQIGSLE